MNDLLYIAASIDCGANWKNQDTLKGVRLGNNGMVTDPLTPVWNQWKEQSVPVSLYTGRSEHTIFRFRFMTGTDYSPSTGMSYGTGNNFYLDRLRITNTPLGVKNGIIVNLGMSVAPNPTNGAATVSINGGDNSSTQLYVTDMSGRLVYEVHLDRKAAITKMSIPAEAIAVKGLYLIKVITAGATQTQKLVTF